MYLTGIKVKMHKTSKLNFAPRRRLGKPGLLLACMLAGVFLSACASKPTVPDSPENSIAERAQDRWDALLAGDFETAYGFYSPGYRSTASVVDFAFEYQSRRVHWTSAEYKEHNCLENTCTVLFDMRYTINKPVPGLDKWDGTDIIAEKGVRTDGQWWFLPKNK